MYQPVSAGIQKIGNAVKIVIEGRAYEPVIFTPNNSIKPDGVHRRQIRKAAAHGCHLYEIIQTENLAAELDMVLSCDPEAYIIIRYALYENMNNYQSGQGENVRFIDNTDTGMNSLASDLWLDTVAEKLRRDIRAVLAHPVYSRHVIGWHPAAGDCGEWFGPFLWDGTVDVSPAGQRQFRKYLRGKYETDRALQAAWGEPVTLDGARIPKDVPFLNRVDYPADVPPLMNVQQDMKYIDYLDYYSGRIVDCIETVCRAVKEETGGRSLTVVFYGYHYEVMVAASGHFSLARLACSPYIDVFSSPVSYSDRNEGGAGHYMTSLGTVLSAGKLWIDEADYRSPVKTNGGQNDIGGVPEGIDCDEHIGTMTGFMEVVRRQFGKSMVYGTGTWWFDLPARGWFDSDEFWEENERLTTLAGAYSRFQLPQAPEAVLITDERSASQERYSRQIGSDLRYWLRDETAHTGLSFGYYTLENLLSGELDHAKLIILSNPFRLDDSYAAALAERLNRPGRTVVWMYGTAPDSVARFQELTGLAVRSSGDLSADILVNDTGRITLGPMNNDRLQGVAARPFYYVETEESAPGTEVWGTYRDGRVGFCVRKGEQGSRAVFCGASLLRADQIRALGRWSGCHVFSEEGDVVYANSNMAVIHASSSGHKHLAFPQGGVAYEYFTGTWYEEDTVGVYMEKGTTRFFLYGGREDRPAIQNAAVERVVARA